jgi:hypothetical protein
MFFQVVGARIVLDERVTVAEIHHHHQRVRLSGFVGRHTDEHLAAHLQRGLTPCRRDLHIRQGATEGFDRFETAGAWHSRRVPS